jgi:hypothetical protein
MRCFSFGDAGYVECDAVLLDEFFPLSGVMPFGTKFLIARYTPDAWRMRARPKKV